MKVAILGATGLVGRSMLALLADSTWVDDEPVVLASERGAGSRLRFRGAEIVCRDTDAADFTGVDVALFSAGSGPSRRWGPVAVAAGCRVVDNSSAWRMEPAVPLIVPEINGDLLDGIGPGIVANPNCSTIQIAMAVAPLERAFGLDEVHVTTLQAVSGAGQAAVTELARQNAGADPAGNVFPRPMAGNVIPAIGAASDDGSYEEEDKVLRELRKILGRGRDLAVSCTATRVPVVTGHGAAVRVVCKGPVDTVAAREALSSWPGVEVADDPHGFATPREIAGRNVVHVGRVRRDPCRDDALLCWVVADNLLKGAAWNAVQIAELLAGAAT